MGPNLADIPTRPRFDALTMSPPMFVQMNPDGKWENSKPQSLEEDLLKAVIQHLVNTKALTAVHSYCTQCALQRQKDSGGQPNKFVPVIMMPIYPADQCPFDMECEIRKMEKSETKPSKKGAIEVETAVASDKDKDKKKKKAEEPYKRLTDFDLLSQW